RAHIARAAPFCDDTITMKAVSRFEFNLLRILHGILGRLPLEQVRPLVVQRFEPGRPPCLSRDAIALIQDTLARGIVAAGARGGGWRRERFLRNGQPRLGRLWERTPPRDLGLSFGRCTLDFLMWLTAVKPTDAKSAWQPPEQPAIGDLLLLTLAYDVLRNVNE